MLCELGCKSNLKKPFSQKGFLVEDCSEGWDRTSEIDVSQYYNRTGLEFTIVQELVKKGSK